MYILFSFILNHPLSFWRENVNSEVKQTLRAIFVKNTNVTKCLMVVKWLIGISKCAYLVPLQYIFHMFLSLHLSPLCQINMLGTLQPNTGVHLFEYFSYDDQNLLTFILLIFMELYIEMQVVVIVIEYCIPKSLFFLHKIIPRTTNRMITDTDDTATAMVEVSVVSGTGVFAWTLEDVVVLVL